MSQRVAKSSAGRVAAPYLVRRLRTLHDGVARDFAAALSGLMRSCCVGGVTGVEQLPFDQFLDGVEPPACLYLLKADSLDGRILLSIEPAILYSMIDRLLGGSGNDPPPGRPMTEIDQCVAARVVRTFCHAYGEAWKGTVDLRLDVVRLESDPQLAKVWSPDETAVLVTFELVVGELRGQMRLGLPSGMAEKLAGRLTPSDPLSPPPDATVDVTVTLATTPITGRELNELRPGDIIATETPAGGPAIVCIAGQPRFQAKPGQYQGRKAAVILEPIEPD